jgi:hypothetical protein
MNVFEEKQLVIDVILEVHVGPFARHFETFLPIVHLLRSM